MKTFVFCLLLVCLGETLAQKFRAAQRCGPGYPAPDGTPEAICDQYGDGPCCSPYGWCGWQDEYCKCAGCQDFRDFREDLRCGPGYAAPSGKGEAICDKTSEGPCCSQWGWCGNTDAHCKCDGCTDFRLDWRKDQRCGPGYPAPSGKEAASCDPHSEGPCCSQWGWCGKEDEYCECPDCVDYRV